MPFERPLGIVPLNCVAFLGDTCLFAEWVSLIIYFFRTSLLWYPAFVYDWIIANDLFDFDFMHSE